MSDAMLWTIIGAFVTAQVAVVAGVLYVVTVRIDVVLTKRLAPIERDLHDVTRDVGKLAQRLTRGGIPD